MAATKKVEPYGFDPAFERNVVALACSRPRFYGRVGHALEADALHGDPGKLALQAAQAIATDLGHGPDNSLLVIQRLRRWVHEGKVTLEQVQDVGDLFDAAEDAGLLSEEGAVGEVAPILQRRMQSDAVRESMAEFAKRGDFQSVADLISKAGRIGVVDTSLGTQLGSASFAMLDQLQHTDRLTTGITELDLALEGGVPRGTLSVVVGGPGDGKSMFLAHQTESCIMRGMHVGYASLEIPEPVVLARLMAGLTGIPINAILDNKREEAKRKITEMEGRLGKCVVKYFTPHATTVGDLKEWVKQCEDAASRKMDVLVVDYADKLTAETKDKTEYQAMRVVYEGLRIHAVERDNWVWTASQAKGQSKESKKRTDVNHLADSMHKGRAADLVMTLNARGEEAEEMMIYIAKFRLGKSRIQVGPMPTDFACGRLVAA